MANFTLTLDPKLELTPAQRTEIEKFGAETGGTLEVLPAEDEAVLVRTDGGKEYVYLPDGSSQTPR